jgi:aldehyde dehydrogenase (NAD+)
MITSTTDRTLTRNLVGGAWRDVPGERLEVRNPADLREVVGAVPRMDAAAIADVYAEAERGAAVWRATSAVQRGRVLLEAAALLRQRRAPIAQLLSLEMGKTLGEAAVEVTKAADFLEYYGGIGRAARGEVLPHERDDVLAYTVHEPLGVVLAITPWNDPLLTPARKLAPALVAGNAVVLKPASYTPLVAIELAGCLHDAGLPAGVVNTVTGAGSAIGDALIDHPALRAVSFTGSNDVGLKLRRALADTAVPLLAELGGKNAAIVRDDADLDLAADLLCAAAFAQAGQRCTATSRAIVHRDVCEPLLARLRARVDALVVGPGTSAATTMGPLVAGARQEEVLGFIERAVLAGATVVTGGAPPQDDTRRHGCYVLPTILADVSPAMEIWQEEVFGPVLTVHVVDDDDEALAALNDSRYGLAAALFTAEHAAVQRFVRDAAAGQVAVNLPTSGWDVHMPFGGFKASGSGHKEQGVQGLDFYRQTKTVVVAP